METYNLSTITKKIYYSGLTLFTAKVLTDILETRKENTTFNVIKRLIESGVIEKIERNKYMLSDKRNSDFSLSYFLYQPSYISFETALNFYGILSQFPYEITAATQRKTKKKEIKGKMFSYVHLKKDLFWGYNKKEDYLIASPEKALLDQLYFASKGLKKADVDEYDFSFISTMQFKIYVKKYPQTVQWKKIINDLSKYISL